LKLQQNHTLSIEWSEALGYRVTIRESIIQNRLVKKRQSDIRRFTNSKILFIGSKKLSFFNEKDFMQANNGMQKEWNSNKLVDKYMHC